MKVSLKKFPVLTIQILLLIISCFLLLTNFKLNESLTFNEASLYGTVVGVILWIAMIWLSRSVFSNISFLYLSFTLFQFGIPILYATDKSYSNFYIGFFTPDTLMKGTIFTIFCIQAFALGITVQYLNSRYASNLIFSRTKWANNNKLVEKSALFLLIICALIYVPATMYGAFVLHSRFSLPAIGGLAKQLFFPLCLLILCYSKSKGLRRTVYSIYLLECIFSMMTGARTEGLVPLMVLIVYLFQYRKNVKVTFLKTAFLSFLLLVIIILLVVIARLRVGNDISSQPLGIGNIYESFVGELGFNFTTILFVISGIGIVGYKYGMSYLSDLVTLYPQSLDPTGIVKTLQNMSGSSWLQEVYGTKFGFGLGFSLIGEVYWNFGNYGVIVIFLFGMVVTYLQAKPAEQCSDWEKYIELAMLLGLLTISRRDFYQFLKQIEYSIFVVALYLYAMSKFTWNSSKKGKHNV